MENEPTRIQSIKSDTEVSEDGKTAIVTLTTPKAPDVKLLCNVQLLHTMIAELQRVVDAMHARTDALSNRDAIEPSENLRVEKLPNRPYLRISATRKSGRMATIVISNSQIADLVSTLASLPVPPRKQGKTLRVSPLVLQSGAGESGG